LRSKPCHLVQICKRGTNGDCMQHTMGVHRDQTSLHAADILQDQEWEMCILSSHGYRPL
jgi:hypothetical protein